MWFILTLDDRVVELEKETNSNILKLVEAFFSCLIKNMISFSSNHIINGSRCKASNLSL